MKIESYKNLIVWQKSVLLTKEVYKLTNEFPKSEAFGITSQMRRSSVSIASNIAEGKYRGSRKDFTQFLRIARGSAAELETQLMIARQLGYGDSSSYKQIENLIEEVSKMLSTLIQKLQTTNS